MFTKSITKTKSMAVKNQPQSNTAVLESIAKSFYRSDEYALVFIDSAVDELELLRWGVKEPAKVFILHPHEDGIEQITTVLNQEQFSSVHIVAHGAPGSLRLGSTRLNDEKVDGLDWKGLGGKSLLIYGCQVASGEKGESFIKALHQATGANIAAATHRVGNSEQGARWTLDYHIGQIPQPELAFTPEVMESYSGTFIEVSLSADTTTLIEDEGTETTLTIQLDEPPPEGGLTVSIGTGQEFALGNFDVFPPPPQATATGGSLIGGFDDSSGFEFLVQEQTATITLPIFDDSDLPPDDPDATRNDDIGVENLTFSVLESDNYTVSSDQGAVTLTLADTASQLDGGNGGNGGNGDGDGGNGGEPPTVNLEITPDQAVESEGTVVTWDFTVDGDIPEDGLYVYVDSDSAQSLNEFDLFQLANTGGDFPVGDFDFTGFAFNITEPEASITIPVVDDGIEEGTEEITYQLETRDQIDAEDLNEVESAGGDTIDDYVIGSGTDTITIADTAEPPPPPEPLVVGISAAPTDLVEEDGTTTTLTFNLSEAPPEGGVEVTVDSDIISSLDEFDLDAANFSGAELVATDDDASGFTVNITQQQATVELPVSDDDLDEGIEEITYALQTSADYEIDEDASSVTLSIEDDDAVVQPPDNAAPVADEDSYTTTTDNPLTVSVDEGVLVNDTDPDGDALVATFVGDASNGSVQLQEDGSFTYTPNPGFVGTDSFTYQASDGEATSEPTTVTVEVEEEEVVSPDVPVVSFNIEPDTISEAEGTELVMNFSVDGEIPEGGITVSLEGDAPRIQQELIGSQTRFDEDLNVFYRFDTGLVEENVVGGELDQFALEADDPSSTGFLSDFTFTITEPNASITFPIFDDLIEEEDETFTYTLVDGENYDVDPDSNSDSFTVIDGVEAGVGPTVGVTASPDTLVESEQTVLELTFNLDEPPPADGVVVYLDSGEPRSIAEFDINASNPRDPEDELAVEGVEVEGGNIVGTNETVSAVLLRMSEQTTTLRVPVFQDEVEEGTETFTYTLLDGEAYEVDDDAASVTFTIEDGEVTPPTDGGTDGDDTLRGDDGDDRIAGAGGNDNLSGDEGDDLIAGNLGNDVISGGEGEDTLYGGDGDDTLRGEEGDDRASGGSGNDSLIGGEGDDLIAGNLGDDTASGGEGDDTVYGGDGTDLITGEEGDDYLVGVNGDDIIFAGEDDDFVGGAAGDDTLSGDAGHDTISGGVGDDLIMGVTGDDLIAGNAGSDTFVFGNGDGTDTIRDFQLGTDLIGLVEGELMYEDLSFAAVDAGLAMEVTGTGETLAILNGLDVESLSEDSFVMVPDISDPSQVLG